jgi:copper chaperone CopZ
MKKQWFILLIILGIHVAYSQETKKNEIKILTSAECTMCKKKLEETLIHQPGVRFAKVNIESKIATVTYNDKKTNPDLIRKAITEAGYDADSLKANPESYDKLPDCCKKGGHH